MQYTKLAYKLAKSGVVVKDGKVRMSDLGRAVQVLIGASMTRETAYKILEIDPSQELDLKAAYRKAALKNHPDHGGSEELMKLVNQARDVLENSDDRRSPGVGFDFDGRHDPVFQAWKRAREQAQEQGRKDREQEQRDWEANTPPAEKAAHYKKMADLNAERSFVQEMLSSMSITDKMKYDRMNLSILKAAPSKKQELVEKKNAWLAKYRKTYKPKPSTDLATVTK